MTHQHSNNSTSSTKHPGTSDGRKSSPKVNPIQIVGSSGTQELTPLQRQRLDTAVMLLVNYLRSASSQS
jgi:hypothetical protein